MKATYNPTEKTKYTPSHRKENSLHKEFALVIPSEYRPNETHAIATLRIYWPGTVAYACLWVNSEPVHTSGSGSAGGGGYCKMSAAAGEAITNAGFNLDKSIRGVGESAVCEAMHALAECLGHPEALLHIAHG
jgi:hypothetical protein